MDTILHTVEIQGPAEKVYEAIATGAGLASWWSTQVSADERPGGTVRFRFIPDFNPEMEITELKPAAAVAWKCVGGAAPWLGASIRFDLASPQAGHTQLMFRQSYAGELPDVVFGTFAYNWAHYLHSLQQYVETGAGFPHPAN
jgi:uncharacterized protein YndB with AHSA1/START domain